MLQLVSGMFPFRNLLEDAQEEFLTQEEDSTEENSPRGKNKINDGTLDMLQQ